MASDSTRNLQEVFLKHLQDHKVPVTIFLVNGVKLQGYITRFDKFGVALMRDRQTQLVYKHAISSISPLTDVRLFAGSEESVGSE